MTAQHLHAFDLSARLAVVTGARRGIGLAIAEALAAVGADIVAVSKHRPMSGAVRRACRWAAGRSPPGGARSPPYRQRGEP